MIRVLLVEDSRAVVAYLQHVLAGEPGIELLPPALDGRAGVEAVRRLRPDVVLMDLELPVLDGLQATREIMADVPTPIVVLSAFLQSGHRDLTFDSLQAGAVDVMAKPESLSAAYVDTFRRRLVKTLRLMATARVVRRFSAAGPRPLTIVPPREVGREPCDLVVVGSSTGGPPVLQELLRRMPRPACVPVVIAQHIIPGFEHGLAKWLAETGHAVAVAADGAPVAAGTIYLSPADANLALDGGVFRVEAAAEGPVPSVNRLFFSAAAVHGPRAVGVLLSGMGTDGAQGLAELRRAGALTLAQRGDTCVVDGMPAAARALDAVAHNLTPAEIGDTLAGLCARTRLAG